METAYLFKQTVRNTIMEKSVTKSAVSTVLVVLGVMPSMVLVCMDVRRL